MTYEETPISKRPSKTAINKATTEELNRYGTGRMLGHLTIRHKFLLVSLYAIGCTVMNLFPALPNIIGGFVAELIR